jgi:hypothetical protein
MQNIARTLGLLACFLWGLPALGAAEIGQDLGTLGMLHAAQLKGGCLDPGLLDGLRSVSTTVRLFTLNPDASDDALLDQEGLAPFVSATAQACLISDLNEALKASGLKVNDSQYPVDGALSLVVIQCQPALSSRAVYVVFLQARRNVSLGGVLADKVPVLVWESEAARVSLAGDEANAQAIRCSAQEGVAKFIALCKAGPKKFSPYSHYRDLR